MPVSLDEGSSRRRDKYSRGKPRTREAPATVEQVQRFLMYLRSLSGQQMSYLAVAEYVGNVYQRAGAPHLSPIPPIDDDADRLARVRRESQSLLKESLRKRGLERDPTEVEHAVEVARTYRTSERAAEAARKKVRRLIAEAEQYEYAFPGLEATTGRQPLPPPRKSSRDAQ
jgi:hypothetical protein